MTPVELSNVIYHDEDAARAHLEAVRWPDGPTCPHCGVINEGIRPLLGNSMGSGWYYCTSCKDKFTVRMGAIYERSHLPLHKWLLAFRLMASSNRSRLGIEDGERTTLAIKGATGKRLTYRSLDGRDAA